MYAEWLILLAYDHRHCMLPSNDVSRDLKVDLASPGVVTLALELFLTYSLIYISMNL